MNGRRRWRILRRSPIPALAFVVLACGSGEDAGANAHTDLGQMDEAGAHDAADATSDPIAQKTPTGADADTPASSDAPLTIDVSTRDAASTIDSATHDVATVDASLVESGFDASRVVDGADTAPALDASSDADSCVGDACGSIGIGIGECPQLEGFTVNPVVVTVGEDVHVTSSATGGHGAVTFYWTATQGTFVDPNAANTTFHCSMVGKATLSIDVSDAVCGDSDGADVDIQCD